MQLLGDRAARDIAYGGALNPVDYACEVGLVDEVFPAEVEKQRFEQICERYAANRDEQDEIFVDTFYQPEVQVPLQEAAKKF